MQMKEFMLLCVLAVGVAPFTFLYPSISVSVLTINTPATYTIYALRNLDDNLNPTPYATQLVPAGSTITVAFPPQYNLATTTPACSSLLINDNSIAAFATSVTGNNITISNAIASSSAIANVTVVITGVTNPSPAITTDPFVVYIGQDASSSSTTVSLTAGTFRQCSITFSPAYVNTTEAMVISLNPLNSMGNNGYVRVQFSSNLKWLEDDANHVLPISTVTCSPSSGQVLTGTCVGQTAYSYVDFTITSINGSAVSQQWSFRINGLFSPPITTPADSLALTSYSSTGSQIDTCTTTITGLLPQALSVSLTSNSGAFYVNTASSFTLTFTLTDTLTKSDYFVLIFPAGTTFALTGISGTNLSIFISGATYTSSNLTLISRQSGVSPTRSAGTICKIIIAGYTAPTSVKTTPNFILQVLNSNNHLRMQGTATVTALPNTYSMNVTASTYNINQNANYTFTFASTDYLTNTSFITLTFPSELTLTIPSRCLTANFSSPALSTCSQNGSSIVRLDSLTTSGIGSNTYSMSIQSATNPGKAISSVTFSASFYYINDPSYLVATATFTGITYLANQLSIPSTAVSISDYHVLFSPISANITFTIKDAVAANAYILISIPPEITIVNAYIPQCLYTSATLSFAAACSINAQVFKVSLGSQAIPANQTITIALNNFGINPKSTRPTSTFQLYIYSPDNYLVNYLNSSLTISSFLPIDYNFITITPSNFTNAAVSPYTFYFLQTAAWDNSSYLTVKIPSAMAFASNPPVCTNLNTNLNLNCSISNTTTLTLSLPPAASSLSLSLSLKNPPSYRPSSNFLVTTYTADGFIYATDNAVSVTTTSPSDFAAMSYNFTNPYYNQSTNLTISITNTAAITTAYTLSNINQFSTGQSITCTSQVVPLTCNINGSLLMITSTTGSAFPLNMDVTIINLFVPMANVTQLTLKSYDAAYLMNAYSSISFQTGCSLPCYTCQSPSSPLVCLSCYPNTQFTNQIYFFSNNCFASCPTGSFNANGSLTCSSCTNSCAECLSGSSFCTECVENSTNPILYLSNNTCIPSCPAGSFKDNSTNATKYTPVCSACRPPCSTCITATVCLSCLNSSLYYYNNQCIAACPALVTVANATSMQCDLCASICLTCANSTTTCLSCNASIAPIFYVENQTCVNTCPSPLVVDGTKCSPCASPCSTCAILKTNCTSCLNGTFLSMISNGSCLPTCDQGYFGNTTTLQCQLCSTIASLNCRNCLSATSCKTCDAGFVYFTSNSSCLSQTPSGYTNISGIAVACTSNCSECSSVTYNCSGCAGNFSLYLFAGTGYCLLACPNTTLSFNNTCIPCSQPCLTCSASLSNCTSCLTGYLIPNNASITCIASCPAATFLNLTTSTCSACSSPCQNCLGGALMCTSCLNSSNYISNSTCVSACPDKSLVDIVTKTCYTCVSPCLTCSVSANNCTQCINGYYFIVSSNQCLISCPTLISVPDPSGTFTCVSCSSNCYTCSLKPGNCSSCIQTYSFFNNTCILACPLGFYSSNNVCVACVNNCSTCTSATQCSTCLSSALFYQSQCLATCPVNSSIIINKTCTPCSNSCLNCSSSDVCYACPSSTALYQGSCVTSCPAPLSIYFNTSSNKLNCFTSSQIAAQNLQDTLQITSVLPLPFTIITTFLFLCCLMSKIQNMETYVIGVGYSLYGIAEVGSLGYLLYIYNIGYSIFQSYSLYFMLMVLTLGMVGLLNMISLACVTPFLTSDPEFNNWLKYKRRGTPQKDSMNEQSSEDVETNGSEKENQSVQCCSHKCTFAFFTIASFLISYKFKLIIFTKLFRFNCLTAHLQNVHGFRAFNVLSFFGIIHEGFATYITIKFLLIFGFNDNKLYLATIDCLIVTLISFILALMTTQKEEDFFKIHNDFKDGIDLGHRKKDKDHKNFKIDEKRLKGMDSRDKLIDVGYEHSEVEEEEVIVNHNIINQNRPQKVGSGWVEVDPNQPKRRPKSPKTKDSHNIFDVEQYEDDGYIPMTEKDRIELFHTSIKPGRKKIKGESKVVSSRVDDWVQANLDSQMLKQESKFNEVSHPKTIYNNSDFQENQIQKTTLLPPATKKLNLQQSTVNIDLNDGVSKTPAQQPILVSAIAQPIIKQTDSQYVNSNKNQPSAKNNEEQPPPTKKAEEIIIIEPNQLLNHTIEEGIIIAESSVNKSYESILPFVHENGVLRQKKAKAKKEEAPRNQRLMIVNLTKENGLKIENQKKTDAQVVKADMAVVANSSLFDQERGQPSIKLISEKEVNLLEEALELSAIQQPNVPATLVAPKIEKVAQAIQVEDLDPLEEKPKTQMNPQLESINPPTPQPAKILNLAPVSSIIIPPSNTPKPMPTANADTEEAKPAQNKLKKKLDFISHQMSQKIEPEPQPVSLPPPLPLPLPLPPLPVQIQQYVENKQQTRSRASQSRPIVHAPKVYKSSKLLRPNQEMVDEFDDQLHRREEELNRIRGELQRNTQANHNIQTYSRSHKRNKSKQSIKSYIDDALKSRQGRAPPISANLIVKEQNRSQTLKEKTEQAQLEQQLDIIPIIYQPSVKQSYESSLNAQPMEEPTVKNDNISKHSSKKDSGSQFSPSRLSKQTEQLIKPTSKNQISRSSQKNIFDRVVYADSLHPEQEVELPENTQKSFINQWNNASQQRPQPSQISASKSNSNAPSSEHEQPPPNTGSQQYFQEEPQELQDAQHIDNQYVINVQQQKEISKIEKESQAIDFLPSQSDHASMHKAKYDEEAEVVQGEASNASQEEEAVSLDIEENDNLPESLGVSEPSLEHIPEKSKVKQKQVLEPSHPEIVSPQASKLINMPFEEQANNQQIYQQQSVDKHILEDANETQNNQYLINAPFRAEESNHQYEQSREQSERLANRAEAPSNLFRVEYANGNLDPQDHSHREFTVQNVNHNYLEVQNQNNTSQSNQLSLELRKTSKRTPQQMQEYVEPEPIRFIEGKTYVRSELPDQDGHTIPGKIRRKHPQQLREPSPTARQSQSNNDHIVDLLKNVNRGRNRKSMPKEERDERIAISLNKNIAPKPKLPHENTNLTRKSMEKNKPINQFKFQNRNEEYGEEEEEQRYRRPIPNNTTNTNLVRPIDRTSSLRQSNTTPHLGPKQNSLAQNNAGKNSDPKMQEIREFNFGDEISSDRSNPIASQPEIVKWKQQFVKQHQFVNFEPEEGSQAPQLPILSKVGRFNDHHGLEVIQQQKISRKRSKRSKQKPRKASKERKGELERIYGR